MRKVLAALLMALILLVAAAAAEVQEGRQAVSVGDIVSFGCYEQDSDLENGPEAIEWIVLDCDEENHRVLLLSRFGLDTRPYHSEYADVTWETCCSPRWTTATPRATAIMTPPAETTRRTGFSC